MYIILLHIHAFIHALVLVIFNDLSLIGDDDEDEKSAMLTESIDARDSVPTSPVSMDTESVSSSMVPEMIMSESLEDLMANEAIMSRVRQKGRELYCGMPYAERKALLEKQVEYHKQVELILPSKELITGSNPTVSTILFSTSSVILPLCSVTTMFFTSVIAN